MRIGILTYHRAHNYGAQLQACALCNRLNQDTEIEAEIIDFMMKKEKKFYSIFAKRRIRHMKTYLRNFWFEVRIYKTFEGIMTSSAMKCSHQRLVSDSLAEFQKFVKGKYDIIIAGSDEIWKIDGYRGFPTPYWLFGNLECRKFSYAASSRSDFMKLNEKSKELLVNNFREFEYIGVREKCTKDSLEKLGIESSRIHVCCDPTFLYDFPVRTAPMQEVLTGKAKLDASKRNIVVMTNNYRLGCRIREVFSDDFNLISVFNKNSGYYNVPNLTPLEWAETIKNADMVLTTYFHGTCFSIIYNTPFISFGSETRNSKISSLFENEDILSERYVMDTNAFVEREDFREAVLMQMKSFDASEYVKRKRESFLPFIKALHGFESTKEKNK